MAAEAMDARPQERASSRRPLVPRSQRQGRAKLDMPLLPLAQRSLRTMPESPAPQGMNTPARNRATMRSRPALPATMSLHLELLATTSPALRAIGRDRPFRCGMLARSMRGNGSSRNG